MGFLIPCEILYSNQVFVLDDEKCRYISIDATSRSDSLGSNESSFLHAFKANALPYKLLTRPWIFVKITSIRSKNTNKRSVSSILINSHAID